MVAALTNDMGFHQLDEPTSDWLGRSLGRICDRSGQNSPVYTLHDSTTKWRDPTSYSRRICNVRQPQICVNQFGFDENVVGELSGCVLVSDFGGNWNQSLDPVTPINAINEAINKCLLKIGNQKAQFGNFIAESHQVLDMIAKTSVSVFKAYKAVKHGNVRGLTSALGLKPRDVFTGKSLSERWLEYQYGWKPLLNDLHSAYGVLTDSLKQNAQMVSAIATAKRQDQGTIDNTFVGKWSYKERVKVRIDARIVNESMHQASQVGLLNPLAVAWEVVPFSFLIDWFMPIGNMFEASTAHCGLEFVGGSNSWTQEGTCTLSRSPNNFPAVQQRGSVTIEKFAMTRYPFSGWPDALPYSKSHPWSSTHVDNALALFRGFFH